MKNEVFTKKGKRETLCSSLEYCTKVLQHTGKVLFIAPKSFENNWVGTEIAKSKAVTGRPWGKVIFVVPLSHIQDGVVEKYKHNSGLRGINCEFITYQALGLFNKMLSTGDYSVDSLYPALRGMERGLFVFEEVDEVELGDDGWCIEFIYKIGRRFPNAFFFGSSFGSTSSRVDSLFNGNKVIVENSTNGKMVEVKKKKPLTIFDKNDLVKIGEFGEYKGFVGSIEYKASEKRFQGRFTNKGEVNIYKADNVGTLELEFHRLVDKLVGDVVAWW